MCILWHAIYTSDKRKILNCHKLTTYISITYRDEGSITYKIWAKKNNRPFFFLSVCSRHRLDSVTIHRIWTWFNLSLWSPLPVQSVPTFG
jgi:hypothetical protein